ncbi:MAG: ABC transporter permease [Gemmobacter sp.]|nr:ABC transporter permease [Gemmobacter sp.]
MDRQRTLGSVLLSAWFWLIVVFMVFPIFVIIPLSFGSGDLLQFPPQQYGLRWYHAYINDPLWMQATWLSFKIALISGVIATITGTMAVIALERHLGRSRVAFTYLITSPIIVPHIFIALGIFIFALRNGLSGSQMLLIGAHAMVALPFVVLIIGASYRQIDPTIERAARVLGAGPMRAFMVATFPSLMPAGVAAFVFAFFVSFDELIIAQFLLKGTETLPMRIWANLQLDISPTVAAVASLLIVVTTVAMAGAEILRRRATQKLAD